MVRVASIALIIGGILAATVISQGVFTKGDQSESRHLLRISTQASDGEEVLIGVTNRAVIRAEDPSGQCGVVRSAVTSCGCASAVVTRPDSSAPGGAEVEVGFVPGAFDDVVRFTVTVLADAAKQSATLEFRTDPPFKGWPRRAVGVLHGQTWFLPLSAGYRSSPPIVRAFVAGRSDERPATFDVDTGQYLINAPPGVLLELVAEFGGGRSAWSGPLAAD